MMVGGAVLLAAAAIVGVGVINKRRAPQDGATAPVAAEKEQAALSRRAEVSGLRLEDRDKDGKLRWRIKTSGKIDFDQEKMTAKGRDICLELVRGEKQMMLLAPEFAADYKAEKMWLSRGIEAQTAPDGLSFKAGSLVYDMASQHLRATDGVEASLGEYELRAGALGFDREADQTNLVGDVLLKYKDFVIRSGKVVLSTATGEAVLTDGPRVDRGEYRGKAERIEVDTKKQEVRLVGGVQVTRGDLVARAARALLGKRSRRADVTGGVKLKGEGFTASGKRLVIDGAKQTAKVSGGVHVRARIQ